MQPKFPKKRDFWSWKELSFLSKAIGFSTDLFKRNLPKDRDLHMKEGLDLQDIEELIDSKALAGDLHRSFNIHDASYNTKVIEKSIELLSNRFITFQQIKEARVAFQLYEHMDNAGLVINEHIISRTLKLCGRAISQRKLMQHIKHMDRLVPDRLMFYEFLDVYLICDKIPDIKISADVNDKITRDGKDDRSLYPLEDFRNILLTEDEKISEKLNELYKASQEKIPVKKSNEEIKETRPWTIEPTVNHRIREEMMSSNSWQREILKEQLQISNQEVATGGTFPSCSCNQGNLILDLASRQNVGTKLRNHDGKSKMAESLISNRNDVTEHMKYRREQLITDKERAEAKIKVDDLLWNIATQGDRARKRQEAMERRQKRMHHSQAYDNSDEGKDEKATGTINVDNPHKDRATLKSSKEFRRRLKDISTREAGSQSNPNSIRKERRTTDYKDISVDKVLLDERLKQIDVLMERVCQK